MKMNAADLLLGPGLCIDSGDNPAILNDDITVTYNQLEAAACRAANAIAGFGVEPGDRVLIMADDRAEFFYAYLGAMKIGAVPVALNLRFSAANLEFIVADSGCKLILADARFLDPCKQAVADPAATALVALDEQFPSLIERQSDTFKSHLLEPDDMAFWMYTSGTTGKPKAVVHCQRCIPGLGRYLGPVFGAAPGSRIFCSSKLFFAFSIGHTLMAGLRLGATIVLYTGWPSARAIAGVINRHKPSIVLSVPTLYGALLKESLTGGEGFGGVRHFISAGEHLPKALFDNWMAATGNPILQGIGASEALIMYIGNSPSDYLAGATGKPFSGTQVRLVGENGEDIDEPGIPGVLWVRSSTLASQYWNQQAKTSTAFRDDWYVTGDVFFMDGDGFYHYQGRDDDMLKISGQWVSPAEIEDAILDNPRVAEAAVIGVEDTNGLLRLALCLVANGRMTDLDALEEELMASLGGKLSIYKCPRRFIFLDEIPRTASGKMQRFKLRQIAADYLESAS
jgi:benzoate-CoA ligase